MAVFIVVQASTNLIRYAHISYNSVTNLLEILKNDSKDEEGTLVKVFRIEIDTKNFISRPPNDKLGNAIRATKKVCLINPLFFSISSYYKDFFLSIPK